MRYRKHWGKYLFIGSTPYWKGAEGQYKMFSYDSRNLPVTYPILPVKHFPFIWELELAGWSWEDAKKAADYWRML